MCPKKWRFWGEICSKVAISGLKVIGAKSGDFGTLKWRSRKNKIGGPGDRRDREFFKASNLSLNRIILTSPTGDASRCCLGHHGLRKM